MRLNDDPDDIQVLEVERASLPPGDYHEVGFERRQEFDIDIRRMVTEYPAQILEDDRVNAFTAPFPESVNKAVQYGNGIKVEACYLSQFQLIHYQWVQGYFQDQLDLPISVGSLYNFIQQAYAILERFEQKLISKLLASPVLNADGIDIIIDGKKQRLHALSNEQWTLYYGHASDSLS